MARPESALSAPPGLRAPKPQTDLRLMERVRGSSRDAFADLLDRYWGRLVTYAAGIVERRDEAEDVVQETFVRVWQRRAEWTSTGSVSAYLYRITRNLALNVRRAHATEESLGRSGERRLFGPSRPANPQEILAANRLQDEVEAAIASLPERRREVFVLSRFHGLSHREIGDLMGISVQTVSNQMSTALADLRDILAHHLPRHRADATARHRRDRNASVVRAGALPSPPR